MSERVKTIQKFAAVSFDRLVEFTGSLTTEQLDWKSVPEANTIRWILTHLAEELSLYVPSFVPTLARPTDWPKDYTGNTSYTLQKIVEDIDTGKKRVLEALGKLTDKQLDEEVDMWGTKAKRDYAITMMLSEILHHEGQIAAILGLQKRMQSAA